MADIDTAAVPSIQAERAPYSGRHIVTLWMTDRDALCDEVDRLRALVRQIAAWDNHTHHTEEGRNCCPTCLARNGVITEWQAWSESDTVAEYEADDCG